MLQKNKYFFSEKDLHLYDLPQIFAASCVWHESELKNAVATFDLYVRDMPPHRNFLLFGGLDEIIQGIINWKYEKQEIQYLLEAGLITKSFSKYLESFKFNGDIKAMHEGSIFFNNEPVLRITAPIVQANLFTMFFMNAFTGNTKFMSKLIRSIIIVGPQRCAGVAGLRSDSFEYAMKNARGSYLLGAVGGNSVASFAKKFNLPLVQPQTNVFHAVIKSFPSEIEAMRKMGELYKGRVSLTVDTYDFFRGIKNAIVVIKELKQKGFETPSIFIDSGDLVERCKVARKILDEESLDKVKITVATNLDEYKIKKMVNQNIEADTFLLATEITSSSDSPKLETVYKISEILKSNKITYCAKFSQGKETYPGKKQVFRIEENGRLKKDIIGLDDENLGEPQLVDIFKKGKLIYKRKSLEQIKSYISNQILKIPNELQSIDNDVKYEVLISRNLKNLFEKVRKEHIEN
ncbi:MAG: nicotinate phosphoribosyltransferase [Parcubacteria group bacterium Licking1014_1]|nr:MAG: nicotinate phosphoribosyltransferase [Parcubacteria group bacterium Licking1014_1]